MLSRDLRPIRVYTRQTLAVGRGLGEAGATVLQMGEGIVVALGFMVKHEWVRDLFSMVAWGFRALVSDR